MRKVIWATPLYKFLRHCNNSPLDKTVLDCGAGGDDPPLQLFHEYGYKTFGVEVAENPFSQAKELCRKHHMKLKILKGDMRHLPFKSESFSFVYSFNAIFFMTKNDIAVSIKEVERVLKSRGLFFVNFISVDEPDESPFCKPFLGNQRFSKHEDDEPDRYFSNFEIIHKEKRITDKKSHDKRLVQAYIDYIAEKK
ncbi:MAG: class I SAM-dependent methyltransferase [Candidatus Bathyarchaeota archaeon]|jgi:ubiquinone/menaquinone biosynthesis C-methylase UbiE